MVHRSGIGRRQPHMVIERNIRRLRARRTRWHITHRRLKNAQQLIELHLRWRAPTEIDLKILINLLVRIDRCAYLCCRMRELHRMSLRSQATQIKRLLFLWCARMPKEMKNTLQRCCRRKTARPLLRHTSIARRGKIIRLINDIADVALIRTQLRQITPMMMPHRAQNICIPIITEPREKRSAHFRMRLT